MSKFVGFLILFLVVIPVFLFAICGIMAWPFMWLWNYAVVSSITIAKPISYWVAFWLSIFLGLFILPKSCTTSKKD